MSDQKHRRRLTARAVVAVLLVAMGWSFGGVGTAVAGWDDQSDELPGMDTNLTPILIAGGALIALVLILKMSKGGDKKAADGATGTSNEKSVPGGEGGNPVPNGGVGMIAATVERPATDSQAGVRLLAGFDNSTAVVGASFGF